MPRLAYISFDTVPAPKGAATHIEAFARALARQFGRLDLITAAAGAAVLAAEVERWPGVFHTELPANGASLIDRVLCFRRFLEFRIRCAPPAAVQFRSIFEGFPLLDLVPRPKLIFEVNGLPSIELKYRYPRVADDRELMEKMIAQERACMDAADRIVTPSAVTARFLAGSRGADGCKIRVIPNGIWLSSSAAERPSPPYPLLYFGTLSAWQGIDLAIRAVAQLRRAPGTAPVHLTVLGSGNTRQRESLTRLAAKLGVASEVAILPPVERAELEGYLARSFAVLAPLAVNDRNVRQGCCPLKVLEGMAAGVPVIATDLPVTRELGEHGEHLLLVKPGSVDQLALAIERLAGDPELWSRLSRAGREHVSATYTWERAGESLGRVWREILG